MTTLTKDKHPLYTPRKKLATLFDKTTQVTTQGVTVNPTTADLLNFNGPRLKWTVCDLCKTPTPNPKVKLQLASGLIVMADESIALKYGRDEYLNVYTQKNLRDVVINGKLFKTSAPFGNKSLVARNKFVCSDIVYPFYDHGSSPKIWSNIPSDAMGLEIELKFPDVGAKLAFARDINSLYGGFWTVERDGSLEDSGGAGLLGAEIISPPIPYGQLVEETSEVLNLVHKHGGFIPTDCFKNFYGIHVTLNCQKSIKLAASIIRCVNNNTVFSENCGRDTEKLISKSGKHYCIIKPHLDSDDAIVIDNSNDHYRAVFVRGDYSAPSAAEIRVFQSSVDKETVFKYLKLSYLAREYGFSSQIESFEKFISGR